MNIEIAGRCIGIKNNVYIVAELSANHNHDFYQAVQLIKAAKEARQIHKTTKIYGLFDQDMGFAYTLPKQNYWM